MVKPIGNRIVTLAMLGAAMAVAAPRASALSEQRGQPDIFFPKGYDPKKAASMLSVLQDKKFQFVTGLTSYWPARGAGSLAYPTFLDYGGDTASLEQFMSALTRLQGVHVRVSFSRKVEKGSWEVVYSHTAPDTLSVAVNLKSERIDLEKLHLPEWDQSAH